MWAGLASPHQAAALVIKALPKFEAFGGLVSGTAESRGTIGIDRYVHCLVDPSCMAVPWGYTPSLRSRKLLYSPKLSGETPCLSIEWVFLLSRLVSFLVFLPPKSDADSGICVARAASGITPMVSISESLKSEER